MTVGSRVVTGGYVGLSQSGLSKLARSGGALLLASLVVVTNAAAAPPPAESLTPVAIDESAQEAASPDPFIPEKDFEASTAPEPPSLEPGEPPDEATPQAELEPDTDTLAQPDPTPEAVPEAEPEPAPGGKTPPSPSAVSTSPTTSQPASAPELPSAPAPVEPTRHPPFEILGITVPPGETRRLEWSGIESFAGRASMTPVLIAHGTRPGPILCLSAAVHGDELNGIEIVRRFMADIDPRYLAGTVVGVPIVNVYGFQRGSRYLPDRRDLNRFFPGDPRGSSASRIAHMFFEGIIRHCDRLVDVHTGSFHRTNLTQLRADVSRADVRELCTGFGKMPVLHNVGSPGTLRRAATDAGIPAVTIEAGEPMRLDPNVVDVGVAGLRELLANTKMVDVFRLFSVPQPVFYRSTWVRADSGGILFSLVSLGDEVEAGERLATVTDPLTNEQTTVISPSSGTVLGMAVNQFVMPGFAVIRVGIETSGRDVADGTPPSTLGPDLSEEEDVPLERRLDLEERPE